MLALGLDPPRVTQVVAAFHAAHQQVYGHSRPAYFDEYQTYRATPVYQRAFWPLGAQFDGPAIVEQPDTTTVVYPGCTCQVDNADNLLLHL